MVTESVLIFSIHTSFFLLFTAVIYEQALIHYNTWQLLHLSHVPSYDCMAVIFIYIYNIYTIRWHVRFFGSTVNSPNGSKGRAIYEVH